MIRAPVMIRPAWFLLGLFCTSSCAGGESRETYPALSETRAAQTAFRSIQRRFFEEDEPRRPLLRPSLERFLNRYPNDARAGSVRLLLAWVFILEGKQAEAKRLIRDARSSAAPSVRDFAEVAAARLLLAQQAPEAAFAKLAPLIGKLVDADERLIYSELRLQAALASRRYSDALSALSSYLTATPADLGDRARVRAESAVKSLPDAALESSLSNLDDKARLGALAPSEVWLRRVVREQLIRRAVDNKDEKLARRLLDSHPGLARRNDLSAELMQLAANASSSAHGDGNFIGLALEIGDPDAERRSASVARGLAAALSASQPGAASMTLVVKVADAHGVGATLSELSEAGALAVVAGVTDTSAEQAATWAVSGSAPVLLIRDTPELVLSELSFVLGTSDVDQLDAIQKELARRGISNWARVGSGGAECRAAPERAGAGRFPAKKWQADGVDALALLGPRSCGLELLSELGAIRYTPLLALGLEGAELLNTIGKRGVALGAGNFPSRKAGVDTSLDFYEALGRDAGVLLRAAWAKLGSVPRDTNRGTRAFQLSKTLAQVSARLETTDTAGFGGKRRLGRRLSVREAP